MKKYVYFFAEVLSNKKRYYLKTCSKKKLPLVTPNMTHLTRCSYNSNLFYCIKSDLFTFKISIAITDITVILTCYEVLVFVYIAKYLFILFI